MPTGRSTGRTMRVWPAVVLPLGLSFLLGAAAWLFLEKVAADSRRATDSALRLEGYARLEAGELAAKAQGIAAAFVEARSQAAAEQEKNMRVELKAVLEAVSRVLMAGLEQTRRAASPRDGVGAFPVGFESLRVYLELAGGDRAEDVAVRAMRACLPELSAVMPAGAALTVVENDFQEILSAGGVGAPENARTVAQSRELLWNGDGGDRRWTLHLGLAAPDAGPRPDAAEVAASIAAGLADTRLDETAWAGWLVDASGTVAAAFGPPAGEARAAAPYVAAAGEWTEVAGGLLVWQERGGGIAGMDVVPAVAVAIALPAQPLLWSEELPKDARWAVTLGLLGALAVAAWAWFLHSVFLPRQGVSAPVAPIGERGVAGAKAGAETRREAEMAALAAMAAARRGKSRTPPDMLGQRLVKDGAAGGGTARQNVIVADITDEGEVVVEAELHAPVRAPRLVIPSGSLLRLQERHRGGKGRMGCRVLDKAQSPLLRELASRVRPVVGRGADGDQTGSAARVTERLTL